MTWPNLSPAIYRVMESALGVYLEGHLTIEAGTVLEFVGSSGISVNDGAAGLSAIGTKDAPIIFRGVDGSTWPGIGFCHAGWLGNALEFVQIHDAKGPYSWDVCGAGAIPPSIYVGQIQSSRPSHLRIKNVTFATTDKNSVDLVVVKPSELVNEGTNAGTGASGALELDFYQ